MGGASLKDGSILILLNDPICLRHYAPDFNSYSVFDFVPHLRHSSIPNVTDFPYLCHLFSFPEMNSVLIYLPLLETAFLLNLSTRRFSFINLILFFMIILLMKITKKIFSYINFFNKVKRGRLQYDYLSWLS